MVRDDLHTGVVDGVGGTGVVEDEALSQHAGDLGGGPLSVKGDATIRAIDWPIGPVGAAELEWVGTSPLGVTWVMGYYKVVPHYSIARVSHARTSRIANEQRPPHSQSTTWNL